MGDSFGGLPQAADGYAVINTGFNRNGRFFWGATLTRCRVRCPPERFNRNGRFFWGATVQKVRGETEEIGFNRNGRFFWGAT